MVYGPVLTPVSIQQNTPVVVEVQKNTVQLVVSVLVGVVLFTHWIACIVFLVFMYNLQEALAELQKNFQQLGF